jgi:hypothetical protein
MTHATSSPTSSPRAEPIQRDWLAKSLAGVLAGFAFAMGCSGLLLAALGSFPPPLRAQFAMWLVVPVWLGALASCFAARSGLRAWLWLGSGNLAVYALLAILHRL